MATHNEQSGLSEPANPLARANAPRTVRHALPITLDWIWFHTQAASPLCSRGKSRSKTTTSQKRSNHEAAAVRRNGLNGLFLFNTNRFVCLAAEVTRSKKQIRWNKLILFKVIKGYVVKWMFCLSLNMYRICTETHICFHFPQIVKWILAQSEGEIVFDRACDLGFHCSVFAKWSGYIRGQRGTGCRVLLNRKKQQPGFLFSQMHARMKVQHM